MRIFSLVAPVFGELAPQGTVPKGAVDATAILRPAVYLLWARGEVVFVGQSRCPLVRIYTHRAMAGRRVARWVRSKGVMFDQVMIIPTAIEDLDATERKWKGHYGLARQETAIQLADLFPGAIPPPRTKLERRI